MSSVSAMLIVIGSVMYCVGWFSILFDSFSEHPAWGYMSLFVPVIYVLYFWEKCREALLWNFAGLGLIFMAI